MIGLLHNFIIAKFRRVMNGRTFKCVKLKLYLSMSVVNVHSIHINPLLLKISRRGELVAVIGLLHTQV